MMSLLQKNLTWKKQNKKKQNNLKKTYVIAPVD